MTDSAVPEAWPFLEREHELEVLAGSARAAASGHGAVVLVSGEAGIGKSRLVQAARAHLPPECRVLVGQCDEPARDEPARARTLGPFRDLVSGVGAQFGAALRNRNGNGSDRDHVLTALRAELESTRHPTLLAIEDVQWADAATVDVLQYLVRRIHELPVVLVLTYRDDELGHPTRRLLGHAATGGRAQHLSLCRLTLGAVRRICAGSALDAAEIHAVTSGNPFLVAELLATPAASGVPATVVDAVLARLRHLDRSTRAAVEQLAVIPMPIERRLADKVVDGGVVTLAAAEERGLLTVTPMRLSFCHELTRRAIVCSLPAVCRVALHARVLAALVELGDADVARIVHHASEAGDRPAIVRFGPTAARAAARRGAHREAAAHYRLVLEDADAFPVGERAGLLEGYARECSALGDNAQAVAAQERAIDLRRALDDPLAVGDGLRELSQMHLSTGHRVAGATAARAAVAVLEPLDAPRPLAMAYSNLARVDARDFRLTDGTASAERAVALARATGDAATLSDALQALGSCRWDLGDSGGRAQLEHGLQLALDVDATSTACRGYISLAGGLHDRFQLTEAMRYAVAGAELAQRSAHLGSSIELTVLRSRIQVGLCDWDDAVRSIDDTVRSADPLERCAGFLVLGRVAARRGEPEAPAYLATARALARSTGDPLRTGWVTAAATEAAGLDGDHAAVVDLAAEMYHESRRRRMWSVWPELGYWLTRAGQVLPADRSDDPDGADDPYGLLAAGRWREAANRWMAAGDRYGHAMALAESDDPADLLIALEDLDALGARPLARTTRRRLHRLGIRRVPRGPTTTSRANPAGLTARQMEVLRLLTEDLTNTEIADRLVISVRTAGNHVSAVFDKLGVANRADAARCGRPILETLRW